MAANAPRHAPFPNLKPLLRRLMSDRRACVDSGSSSSSSQGVIGQMRGNKKFKLTKKLGSGSFGDIYLGVHVQTQEEVAVKLEPVRTPHPQLLYEAKVIRHLRGGVGA